MDLTRQPLALFQRGGQLGGTLQFVMRAPRGPRGHAYRQADRQLDDDGRLAGPLLNMDQGTTAAVPP